MADIVLKKKNESYIYIDCDNGILQELSEHFTFMVEGYKHMPKYKMGIWDGTIRLLDLRFGTLPCGLSQDLVEYATKLGYETSHDESQYGKTNDVDEVTLEEVKKFVDSLTLHSNDKPLEVREYQYQSIYNCIRNQKQISLNPTGSGKSLIIYCLFRWYYAKQLTTMLVVPNLSLIKQMASDFRDYSSYNGFDVDSVTQVIAEGAEKHINKPLIIATWQSTYKQPSKWFNDNIDVIIADETHQYKADACKGIFEKATDVKYRFGLTGSLDKSSTNKMVLKGLIGPISQVKTTRDLMDDGHLSEMKLNCIVLKYNRDSKKLLERSNYQTEIDFLLQHEKRNTFIRKLALSQKGNTLILFNFIDKHGKLLYEDVQKHATSQKVHYVAGEVAAEEREFIRKHVQSSDVYSRLTFDDYEFYITSDVDVPLLSGEYKKIEDLNEFDDVDTSSMMNILEASTSKGFVKWKKIK